MGGFAVSSLLAILPGLAFVLAGSAAPRYLQRPEARAGWQLYLVCGFVATCGWAALGVVVLSLGHALGRTALSFWWLAGIGALVYVHRGNLAGALRWPILGPFPDSSLSFAERIAAGAVALALTASLAMGVIYPPNNGDSLIYHLPRQMLWISERTVWSLAMPFPHMSIMPPLSEWVSVNLYLLAGTDRPCFLVQWTAYVVCLAVLDLILLQSQASRVARFYASAFFATLPAAFYQASNNKNDLFVTVCLLIVWLVARQVVASGRNGPRLSLAAGVAAGSAMLAKGTALAYLPAIGLVAAMKFRANGARFSLAGGAIFLAAAAAITALHYGAVWVASTGGASSPANATLNAALLSPGAAASVLIRNLALQFALPFEGWNRTLEAVAASALALLGYDASDPGSTFMGTRFAVKYAPLLEDSATAGGHFALALLLGVHVMRGFSRTLCRPMACESAALFALSLLLFSVLFRWQPWHSRLLIPAVAFAAPGVGAMMASWRAHRWPTLTMLALLLWFLPSLSGWNRPLVGQVTPGRLDEDAAVGRTGGAAPLLPAFGHALRQAGATRVWLDLFPGPVHAALRYLPLSTRYGFPATGAPSGRFEAMLTDIADGALSPSTRVASRGLVPVADIGGWRLFLSPEAYRRAAQADALPPISGVSAVAGLGQIEGPYPEFRLPLFANIRTSGVVFEVLPGLRPRLLRGVVAPYARPCRLSIIVDGSLRGSVFVAENIGFSAFEVPLGVNAAPHRIELRPAGLPGGTGLPAEFIARLLKLQLLPAVVR